MAPPHLFLIQGERGEEEEEEEEERRRRESSLRCYKMAVCSRLCCRLSPSRGGCRCVWVNTECIEIHHQPRSATSCNLQSTLTLYEKPGLPLPSFLWWQRNLVWCVCVWSRVCVWGSVRAKTNTHRYGCSDARAAQLITFYFQLRFWLQTTLEKQMLWLNNKN